jgi:putative sterol carrier protein
MESVTSTTDTYVFLSPEWVYEVTRVVQYARRTDEDFGRMASDFSLSLAYVIDGIPEELRPYYDGSGQVAIFVQLDHGSVRKIRVGTQPPGEDVDFTVASNYRVAKQIFEGELNAATSFISRQLKVDPIQKAYREPRFAARSIVTGNLLLKIARQVPTAFVDGH